MNLNIIKSFSYTEDKTEVIETIEKISEREKKKFSIIVMAALEEYAKSHGDGNSTYTLDQWKDPHFKVTPAFKSDFGILNIFQDKCSDSELQEFLPYAEHWFSGIKLRLKKRGFRISV